MTINREHLAPCPSCHKEPAPYWKGAGCTNTECMLGGLRFDYDDWQNKRAQAQAAPEAEPVGHVYTMQPCFPGEPMRAHAQLHKALPAGTKLYASPQHDAELVELLAEASKWLADAKTHQATVIARFRLAVRKEDMTQREVDSHIDKRLANAAQISSAMTRIDAKLATLSAKNEGVKV